MSYNSRQRGKWEKKLPIYSLNALLNKNENKY